MNFNSSGFNLIGYFQGGFGLSQVANNFADFLRKENIPFSIKNIINAHQDICNQDTNSELEKSFPINIFFINASEIKSIKRKIGEKNYKEQYDIGVWFWELEDFPNFFSSSFRCLNEIWVFSNFIYKSLSKKSPIPVKKFFYPYYFNDLDFSLYKQNKTKEFKVITVFDYNSDFDRKNPIASILAFKKAFQNVSNAELIIKTKNGHLHNEKVKELKEEIKSDCRIKIISEYMTDEELKKLWESAHLFLSLHRSEGLGLNILDSINYCLPVVATGYGANIEYMNGFNDFLISYKKIKINSSTDLYNINSKWAEPDIDEASIKIRKIFDDYDCAVEKIKTLKNKLISCDYNKKCKNAIIKFQSNFNLNYEKSKIRIKNKFSQDFFYLNEFLKKQKTGKILFIYSARKKRIIEIIKFLKNKYVGSEINIFGKYDKDISSLAANYYEYKSEGFLSSENIDEKIINNIINKNFDLLIIPYYNYTGQNYQNVFEIAKLFKIKKNIGIGIDDDIFLLNKLLENF